MTRARRAAGATLAGIVLLGLAGCGDDGQDQADQASPSAGPSPTTESSATASAATSAAPTGDPPPDGKPFGPACGRFDSPSGRPVDQIAEMPTSLFVLGQDELRDAFGKMMQVGLGQKKDVTFFLPTNKAINAVPFDVRGEIVTDPDKARSYFGHHVVEGRLEPSQLAGEHPTLNDDVLTVTLTGQDFGVGLQGAQILCGNIETVGARIYVVDQAIIS